jgi:hypothetical protein
MVSLIDLVLVGQILSIISSLTRWDRILSIWIQILTEILFGDKNLLHVSFKELEHFRYLFSNYFLPIFIQ